ncbi:MAG: GIY-YIG nuclease family protein [Elusimicrobia bacterium]|nr:GIY-YIG nuclease family protein [Elusimicrobiota bacterium]
MMWYLYIIRKSNKLYTGITTDIDNRMRQHGNPPVLYLEKHARKTEAVSREKQVKGWSRAKKQNLISEFIQKDRSS